MTYLAGMFEGHLLFSMKYYKHRLYSTIPYNVDFGFVFSTMTANEYVNDSYILQEKLNGTSTIKTERNYLISSTVEISKEDFDNENDAARPIDDDFKMMVDFAYSNRK